MNQLLADVVHGLVTYCLPKILGWLGRQWNKRRRKRRKRNPEKMTPGQQMRRDALRRYFVFRMKLIELFHFHLLWGALADEKFVPENVMDHDGQVFAESVRTALLSWYCTIVDRTAGGLNIFNIWQELFPNHREEIERVRAEVEPHW